MKKPSLIQFVIKKESEGGYSARAFDYAIFTEGDTLDEVVSNIKEATECHFGENKKSHKKLEFPIMVNFALA